MGFLFVYILIGMVLNFLLVVISERVRDKLLDEPFLVLLLVFLVLIVAWPIWIIVFISGFAQAIRNNKND